MLVVSVLFVGYMAVKGNSSTTVIEKPAETLPVHEEPVVSNDKEKV